jgi:hypothetical protein
MERVRSRNKVPTGPDISPTFFMTRISTRTPSPNRLLSVGRVEDWRGTPQWAFLLAWVTPTRAQAAAKRPKD